MERMRQQLTVVSEFDRDDLVTLAVERLKPADQRMVFSITAFRTTEREGRVALVEYGIRAMAGDYSKMLGQEQWAQASELVLVEPPSPPPDPEAEAAGLPADLGGGDLVAGGAPADEPFIVPPDAPGGVAAVEAGFGVSDLHRLVGRRCRVRVEADGAGGLACTERPGRVFSLVNDHDADALFGVELDGDASVTLHRWSAITVLPGEAAA